MKLVWLRRDLRSIDNTALDHAIASGELVTAIFIATPEQWQQQDLAPIQADFIYRRLFALQQELIALNIPLLYQQVSDYQQASQTIIAIAQQLGVNQVLVNRDYEWNEQQRDRHAEHGLADLGITWSAFDDKCIVAPGQVLNKQGEYFKVFTPFKRAWLTRFSPPTITKPSAAVVNQLLIDGHEALWGIACRFDFPRISSESWPVDFDTVRDKLRQFCHQALHRYHQQRDYPALEATSQLSPYLAIGVLSARQCLARMYAQSDSGTLSSGADVWLSELIWREFYQHLLTFEAKLSKGKAFHRWGDRLQWQNDNVAFARWCEGKTGYPIVDAAMRQLNQTGWMHNRLRMVVASFLTKDLHIDWHWGERYFMQQLIDGDYAANNGGWQWCASTGCDGQPYFRIFNPITQGERFDPDGQFIRQWLPELAKVPATYIHSPWKWPGVKSLSYPAPIVDHKTEREVTLSLYKQAKDNDIHGA